MISKENKVFICFHILKIFNFTRGLWKKPIDSSNELRLCCDSLCPVLKRWHIQRGQHVWTQRCCLGCSSWRIFRILKVRKLRNQKSWEKFKEKRWKHLLNNRNKNTPVTDWNVWHHKAWHYHVNMMLYNFTVRWHPSGHIKLPSDGEHPHWGGFTLRWHEVPVVWRGYGLAVVQYTKFSFSTVFEVEFEKEKATAKTKILPKA